MGGSVRGGTDTVGPPTRDPCQLGAKLRDGVLLSSYHPNPSCWVMGRRVTGTPGNGRVL